jgi:hypothetical protein
MAGSVVLPVTIFRITTILQGCGKFFMPWREWRDL